MMAGSRIKDDNYFQVSGWMLNRLRLKGVPLHIYSIIYGFSQDGESYFTGSLQYLMDFTGASKPTVIKALKELVEKGHLLKYEYDINGVKVNKYRAVRVSPEGSKETLPVVKKLDEGSKETLPVVKKLDEGSKETLPGGSKETLPNNKSINNKEHNNTDAVFEMFNSICKSFPSVRAKSEARRKAVNARLKTYSMEEIKLLFEKAESSDFLRGKNWATFDWLIQDGNMAKTLDGNYDNKTSGRTEMVPDWMEEKKRLEHMQKYRNSLKDNPDLQDRAEKLKQSLRG